VSSHALAEVAQIVDNVVIISQGRLVTTAPLGDLTARLGAAVRVRSPQLAELEREFAAADITAQTDASGVVHVHGTTSDRVGEMAAAAGIVLQELATSHELRRPAWDVRDRLVLGPLLGAGRDHAGHG
jgi:ABC-2 type transport system ATP-binding protein